MRTTWSVLAVLLGFVPCQAADPTVVQADPTKNVDFTLHLKATITPAPNQTIISVTAVWRPAGQTDWRDGCFLGLPPGPYEGNTTRQFVTGEKIQTAIKVVVQDAGNPPRQTGALAIKDYTVP